MFYDLTVDYGGVNFPKPSRSQDTTYIGFVSVFTGCNRAISGNPCPDCQNPSLWGLDCKPRFTSMDSVTAFIRKKVDLFNKINVGKKVQYFYAVLGGEPLDQDAVALSIVHQAVRSALPGQVPSVLFTGYQSLNDGRIDENVKRYVLEKINYLKLGPYLGDDCKVENLDSGLATPNQYWTILNPPT